MNQDGDEKQNLDESEVDYQANQPPVPEGSNLTEEEVLATLKNLEEVLAEDTPPTPTKEAIGLGDGDPVASYEDVKRDLMNGDIELLSSDDDVSEDTSGGMSIPSPEFSKKTIEALEEELSPSDSLSETDKESGI
ncbi:MAG: hypothetical protein WDZ75_01270 [Candidatus Paceibacterota bacterium]